MYKRVDLKEAVGFREVEREDETLEADLLSFVREFYDHYTDLGWGTNGAMMAQALALIARADTAT